MAIPKSSERAFDNLPTPGAEHDRLEIPDSSFPGLASLFPEGLRMGSVVSFEGSAGGGVTRLVGEVLAWASNYVGLCALVDTTGCVSPGFLLSLGIHTDRLVVFRIPSAEGNRRLAPKASSLENASSKPNVTTYTEYRKGSSAKILSQTESKSISALGLLVESFSVVAIVSLSGFQPIPRDSRRVARLLAKVRKNRTLLVSATLEPSVTVTSTVTSTMGASLELGASLESCTPSGAPPSKSEPSTSRSRLYPQMFYPKKSRQAGTAFAVSLRNVAWFHDSSGLLYRRLIEARVAHHGIERSLLLEDGAHLERLVPAGTVLGEQSPFRMRTASPWNGPPKVKEQMAGSTQLRATS